MDEKEYFKHKDNKNTQENIAWAIMITGGCLSARTRTQKVFNSQETVLSLPSQRN